MKKTVLIVSFIGLTSVFGVVILLKSQAPASVPSTLIQTTSENISLENPLEDEMDEFYSDENSYAIVRMKHFDAKRTLESLPVNVLRAELRNVNIRDSQRIDVDFVLINLSNSTIRLAERWNWWGAFQWSFRLVDSNGI